MLRFKPIILQAKCNWFFYCFLHEHFIQKILRCYCLAEGKLKNPYLYNDKEMLDEDADLNWYDYGFRNYDPQIGRFMQLDPLTDDYPELTPYQYASCDPITNIDIDGLEGGGAVGGAVGAGRDFSYAASAVNSAMSYVTPIFRAVGAGSTSIKAASLIGTVGKISSLVIQSAITAGNLINNKTNTDQVGDPELPKIIGKTFPDVIYLSSAQIEEHVRSLSVRGLSVDYLRGLVKEEGVTLSMYDVDNSSEKLKTAAGRGGNTTIGVGHLIHYGAIGSTQYDPDALTKESSFKDGIGIDQAFSILSGDLTGRTSELNSLIIKFRIVNPDQSVKDVFMDYIFNTGRSSGATRNAARTYKQGGVLALYYGIKKGSVKSISESRKKMRLKLLERAKAIENFNKGVDRPTKIGNSPSIAYELIEYDLNSRKILGRKILLLIIFI